MKKIMFHILAFLLSLSTFAAPDTLNFRITPGKFHLGGKAAARIVSTNTDKDIMQVMLSYEITKRPLVPAPEEYLKGSEKQDLPLEFIDERGYLNLEAKGPLKLPDATVYHLGRVKDGSRSNAHRVKIVATNGKSETEITYHPHIPELGWVRVKLTIFTPLPLFKSYTMEAVLVD
jgi:hypothetical protein